MARTAAAVVLASSLLIHGIWDVTDQNEAVASEGRQVGITYYLPTGNRMANGQWPFPGAAACGTAFTTGTRLRFDDGHEVVCLDRGWLGRDHVDLFAESHAEGREFVARYGTKTWVQTLAHE